MMYFIYRVARVTGSPTATLAKFSGAAETNSATQLSLSTETTRSWLKVTPFLITVRRAFGARPALRPRLMVKA